MSKDRRFPALLITMSIDNNSVEFELDQSTVDKIFNDTNTEGFFENIEKIILALKRGIEDE